jgi:transposase-like protein
MTHKCVHICPCGSEHHCGDPERCAIGSSSWVCESCLLDQRDRYLSALADIRGTETLHPEMDVTCEPQ